MSRLFWKGVWAEFTGSAERRRWYVLIRQAVLLDSVSLIRRFYMQRPPSDSPEFERGYGEAILHMTRLLDPEYVPPDPGESDEHA